jgi:hypothetical protein
MAKQGGLLVTLGKRILGFNTSSSGCCAGPAAADAVKAPAAKETAVPSVEITSPGPQGASCCAPSCCASTAPADARGQGGD